MAVQEPPPHVPVAKYPQSILSLETRHALTTVEKAISSIKLLTSAIRAVTPARHALALAAASALNVKVAISCIMGSVFLGVPEA